MPVMGPTGLLNDIRGLALGSIRGELFPLVGSLNFHWRVFINNLELQFH